MAKGKVRRLRLDQLNVAQPVLRSGRQKLGALAASIEEVGVLVRSWCGKLATTSMR